MTSYICWTAAVLAATAATFAYNNLSGRTMFREDIERRKRNRRTVSALLAGVAILLVLAGWDAR